MHNTLDCYRFVHRFNQNTETLKLETDPSKRYELEQKLHDNIVSIVKTHEKTKRTLKNKDIPAHWQSMQNKWKLPGATSWTLLMYLTWNPSLPRKTPEGRTSDRFHADILRGLQRSPELRRTQLHIACIECGKSAFQSSEINAKEQLRETLHRWRRRVIHTRLRKSHVVVILAYKRRSCHNTDRKTRENQNRIPKLSARSTDPVWWLLLVFAKS